MKRLGLVALVASLASFAGTAVAPAAPELAIHVHGNHFVDATGKRIRLLGVNFSGAEYACVSGDHAPYGYAIFAAPNDAKAIRAMTTWGIDAVRVPLNEDCWLGINGVAKKFGGARYRAAIEAFVQRLHDAGLYVILDLHWNAPGTQLATGQQRMADSDHSPAFWSSVATFFRDDPAVVFDLYNEPHDIGWKCWRDGCTSPDGWTTAGMQSLVDAVRAAKAKQPVMVGGLRWSNDLSKWLRFRPRDPVHQLAASIHIYDFNVCDHIACWKRTIGSVAKRFPVVAGEIGENDCAHGFIDTLMPWLDRHGVSYLGWTWNVWNCKSGPALITSTAGVPTSYGVGLRDHLRALAGA